MGRLLNLAIRRGSASAWSAANPILTAGEPGFETDTGRLKIGDGSSTWSALLALARLTDVLQARSTATATTVSLVAAAQDLTTVIALSSGYRLYSIATSRPARVRLYTSGALQTADSGRASGVDPTSSAGVILDYVTAAADTTYGLSPLVDGYSAALSANIPMTVTNNDSSTGTIAVTLQWLRTE